MNRLLIAVIVLASSCDCGFQAVEECFGPRCGTDGGTGGGLGGGTGGALGGGTGGALGGGTGGALGGGTGGALGGGTGGGLGGGTGGGLGGGTGGGLGGGTGGGLGGGAGGAGGGGLGGGTGGGGGGASTFDGGTWTCQLPPDTTPGSWCFDRLGNAAQLCSDAALIGEGRVISVAVDPDRVAWTVIDARSDGTVWVATRDGGTPTCVAPYSYPPLPGGHVSLRSGFIYWSDFSVGLQRGFVMRAPLDGGPAQAFSDEPDYPYGLTTSDTHAYWVRLSTGLLLRKALAGGPVETFATAQSGLSSIAFDGAWVYWASGQEIRRAPAAGGGVPTVLLTTPGAGLAQVQVKNGFVYWLPAGDAAVYRRALAGGPTVVVASNPATVQTFETDGTRIYWYRDGPMLFSAPLGGQAVLLLTPQLVGRIAVDGPDLYFGGDTLRRLPK